VWSAAGLPVALHVGIGLLRSLLGGRIGVDAIALAAILGAIAAGAERVVAIDLAQSKLDLARSMGATDTFLASDPAVVEAVKDATSGGVDFAVEMAGSAPAFELAYKITRRGGTTATGGLANPNARISLPPVHLVAEERTIRGSYMGSCVPSRDIPRFLGLYKSGKLPVQRLLSGTGPLEDINAAFDKLDRGEVVRHVITF
jgi:alcohol dehydrogenase